MIDYRILADEIKDDPLGRGYGEMSDAEVLASLEAADQVVRRAVPVAELQRYLYLQRLLVTLQVAASSVLAAAETLAALSTFAEIDYRDDEIRDATILRLDELVAAGIISTEQRADLITIGDVKQSRASELSLIGLGEKDIHLARNEGW